MSEPLNIDALDEMYERGFQPTMDEGKELVAEVRTLRAQNHRLALMVGRRMTGPEIGAVLGRMIDSGELEIPPEGSPMMSFTEVAARLGISLDGRESREAGA